MKFKLRMPPRALVQAATYGLSLLIVKTVAVLMLPVFTHYLTKDDYGRLEVLQTLANLLSIVFAFGLTDTLFRFAGETADRTDLRKEASNAYGMALAATVVTLVIGQLAAPAIAAQLPGGVSVGQTRTILYSLSLSAAIAVPMSWLRLTERPVLYVMGSSGQTVFQAILVATALSASFGPDGVLVAGACTATVAAALLGFIQLRETGANFDLNAWGKMGRLGAVIVAAGIASFVIDTFNRWSLAKHVGVTELAEFAIAAKIGVMAGFLTQPLLMYWLPKRFITLSAPGGDVRCGRMTDLGLVIGLVASVVIAALGPLAIDLLTPPAYHGAARFVPFLALAYAINSTTLLVHTACLLPEKTVWPMAIEWGAAIIACTCYLTLIPVWHSWGAVIGMYIAFSARFLAYVIIGHQIRAIPYAFSRLAAMLAMAIGSVLLISLAGSAFAAVVVGMAAATLMIAAAMMLRLIPAELTSWALPLRSRRSGQTALSNGAQL